jgi:hypothetical protein
MVVAGASISGNSTQAGMGGAVANSGELTIAGTTLDGNSAYASGGAIGNLGQLDVNNTTVSGNDGGGAGGGIYNGVGGALQLEASTVAYNRSGRGQNITNEAGTLSIATSIVAGATSGANCEGTLTSSGNNLDDAATCGFNATGDLTSVDPRLGLLQLNGGATPTHALQADSPAIDLIPVGACAEVDQRGIARPQGAGCDIGAFERDIPSSGSPTPTVSSTPTTPSPTATSTPSATVTPTVPRSTPSATATVPGASSTPSPGKSPAAVTPTPTKPAGNPQATPTIALPATGSEPAPNSAAQPLTVTLLVAVVSAFSLASAGVALRRRYRR